MPRNNATSTASEMLNGLKSRLGFARDEDEDFTRYDADFDDYDDFDDDGYSPDYDDEYAGYGADYDENAPVGAYKPVTTKRPSRYGRGDSTPNLVSIDDVKAHTQVPDVLMRDPLDSSSSRTSSARSSSTRTTTSTASSRVRRSTNRDLVEPSGPAPSSPAYTASLRESASRSEGLNSLFESSSNTPSSSTSSTSSAASSASARSSYDPYEAYSASSSTPHSPARSLTVIKPVAYGDVERVAKSLKGGDVVVLAMRNTPDDLSKRILDFSFGVASALDANVECPAEKVFAIARGTALSNEEKSRLRAQGVL